MCHKMCVFFNFDLGGGEVQPSSLPPPQFSVPLLELYLYSPYMPSRNNVYLSMGQLCSLLSPQSCEYVWKLWLLQQHAKTVLSQEIKNYKFGVITFITNCIEVCCVVMRLKHGCMARHSHSYNPHFHRLKTNNQYRYV